MKKNEISSALLALNQRPIAVYPIYIHMTGSIAGGVLLSQIMYWYSTVNREFYKTDAEFISETHLTQTEFRNAKKVISSLPFVNIRRAGIPYKTYYDVNPELLFEAIQLTSSSVTYQQGLRLSTNKRGGNLPTNTKNTHKTISKTTTKKPSFSANAGKGVEEFSDVISEFKTQGEPEPTPISSDPLTPPNFRATPPKEKQPTETYSMYESWARFSENKGIPVSKSKTGSYLFEPKHGQALKQWRTWVEGMPNFSGDYLADWEAFLEAAWTKGGKWIQSNFTPTVLNSKRMEIVIAINYHRTQEDPELLKFVENLGKDIDILDLL